MKTIRTRNLIWALLLCFSLSTGFFNGAPAGQAAGNFSVYLPFIQKPPAPAPSSGVAVLPGYTSFQDQYGYLHITGEVANKTASPVWNVGVSAGLYDANGQLLNSSSTPVFLNMLKAGDRTCFNISIFASPGWTDTKVETSGFATNGPASPQLAVLNDQGQYVQGYGWYEITGQIQNNGSQSMGNVIAIGTLYNASGGVVGCDYTTVNDINVDPGLSSPFDLTFVLRDYSDVSTYRLQTDGTAR